MAEQFNSLESFEALHNDLLALSESRFSNLARLHAQLEGHIEAFRALLDKKGRNDQSRRSLATGKLLQGDDEYTVNDEFQQGALQLADDLDLDEIEAAQIFLDSQDAALASGRSNYACSVIRFQQKRKILLDCLRLILDVSMDVDAQDDVKELFLAMVAEVIASQNQASQCVQADSSPFVQKCLAGMRDMRSHVQSLLEKKAGASIVGRQLRVDEEEIIEYQRVSLVKQHEVLGVIVFLLVKANHSTVGDFKSILATVKTTCVFDNMLVHQLPALAASISQFGSPEGGGSVAAAKSLDDEFNSASFMDNWGLASVQAAFRVWWLAEYSGFFGEHYDGSLLNFDLDVESQKRAKDFSDAVNNSAFELILSLSADARPLDWYDQYRHGMRTWLQQRVPFMAADSVTFSDFFQEALMEQLETFIESFITNMPDILRKLRTDQDEQRQLSHEHEHNLDLERFIVIISYTFEGRPKAALESFWLDLDGVLIGFMHWASKRASTPLVTAFCEMLQAISQNEACANAAHEFLLDESFQNARIRQPNSLTWNLIFKELMFFTEKLRSQPATQTQSFRPGRPHNDSIELEPDSGMMLEGYLRLVAKLCTESPSARTYLMQHPTFHLTELLFNLASSSIPARFRACAFSALRSLLSQKTKQVGEYMWLNLDIWVSGGYSHGSNVSRPHHAVSTSTSAIETILRNCSTGFEEPNAFIQLLHSLISPCEDNNGLNDGLPFPEGLGSSSRMPGIEPYVDFAVGQVFGSRKEEAVDPLSLTILQSTCLEFIITCLETFNEDLVIFANRSNVVVDTAITTSNLQAYVRLHPFARVMEWMFNSKVMAALFGTLHQDSKAVASSAPDSAAVVCLLRGIRTVTLILDLQSTYLDIVRPLIKSQPTHRRNPVSNAAYAYFEDGVLNHLSVIPDLGLYCGSGHPELVIVSLKLLEKLSASPRLAPAPKAGLGRRSERNKVIAALEESNVVDAISRSLLYEIEANIEDTQGHESTSYIIKIQILDFLVASLEACPGHATIAHLLLGFRCRNNIVDVDPESPFSRRVSLFHAIRDLAVSTSIGSENHSVCSWLVALKFKCLKVLKLVWQSTPSSSDIMIELRAHDTLFELFSNQDLIDAGMLWDGVDVYDEAFLRSTSASCLADFLSSRALTLEYVSAELRLVTQNHSPTLKARIFQALFGMRREDNTQESRCTIYDLFDFMEVELPLPFQAPHLSWLKDLDMRACLDNSDENLVTYDISKLADLLVLKQAELQNTNMLEREDDRNIFIAQARALLDFHLVDNQAQALSASRLKALQAWVQLLLVMIETGNYDGATTTQVALRTMQTVLPRLESNLENSAEAVELARLARALLFSLDLNSLTLANGDSAELVSDRLYSLFQFSLRALTSVGANGVLKEIFYSICLRYLAGMSDISADGPSHIIARHSTRTVKEVGGSLIDLICDDALAGEKTCRIAALLLLGSFIQMSNREGSKYMLESLNRLNFVAILVRSIEEIAQDLSEPQYTDTAFHLQDFNARLALLTIIAQNRSGAAIVLNSGLFYSIKSSRLFAIDPDTDLDLSDSDATRRHYTILSAVMRVICAAIISRGAQNEHTIEQGRSFLSENRLSVLAVLKRSAGLGGGGTILDEVIDDLAESFMVLMSVTSFVESEEKTQGSRRPALRAFT